MNFKKIVSAVSALAISVSAFVGLATTASAAGYTRTLSDSTAVAGYTAKAFYNFQKNEPPVLPETGDLRYREGGIWGLHNFGSGTRSGTATIPVEAGDILVIQEYSASYPITINRGSENATLTSSTGYRVFDISTTASDVTFTSPRYGGVVAALVMEEDTSVQTAAYTINYKLDGVAEPVKVVTGTEAVGTDVGVLSSFFVGGVKYTTDAGQASTLTVVAGGSSLDVTVSEADAFAYTVNATYDGGTVYKTLASSSNYEGESITVPYPAYINVDGTLYSAAKTNNEYRKSYTLSSNNQTENIPYTATAITDVVYYTEGEDIVGATRASLSGNSSNVAIRSSNAQAAYAPQDLTLATLPAGYYKLVGVIFSGSSGNNLDFNFGLGENVYTKNVAGASNWVNFDSEEMLITEPGDFVFKTSGTGTALLDYVYVVKTGDYTPPATPSVSATSDLVNDNGVDYMTFKGTISNLGENTVTKAGFGFVNLETVGDTSLEAYWTNNAVSENSFGAAIEKDATAVETAIWAIPYIVISGVAKFGDAVQALFSK